MQRNYKDMPCSITFEQGVFFIKKDDDEGASHYYLGKLSTLLAKETVISDRDNPSETKPIVNFRFTLHNSVREDLYDYLVT